ncbi:MBL fold metallo-hydrolase [Mariniblastus fucicola]|uniref:Ribonuclease Z n=1 Tax=Mariniblastus fucicola TaxID=980251 RepID=A0A5B9P5S4_9BACT|nr:MBL fold metallo-hydrolase [Mariniblastus fucicola]QEG20525.1 ribonuclease Z [Mariniblastus fucicola]
MNLHFLGTTGYHPNEKRQTACLMIPEHGIIFDAGTGLFRARDLICTTTLDIFLSHVHLDHSIGLTFLYNVLWGKDIERVTVHLDGDKIPAIENALYHKDLFPVGPNFDMKPLPTGPIELTKEISIDHCPLDHPGGSTGYRLQHPGGSLAYITDTVANPNADYVDFIADVDVLVHECYFPDGWEDRAELTGHSCLTPVANVATTARAKQTYLVHMNPLDGSDDPLDVKSVERICSTMQLAEDQMIIEL